MILSFFQHNEGDVYALRHSEPFTQQQIDSLNWLFGNTTYLGTDEIKKEFLGPRPELITPWSTNALEVIYNMGIDTVDKIEVFTPYTGQPYDALLEHKYDSLGKGLFEIEHEPEPIYFIENIEKYNEEEGLALSEEEIEYLKNVSKELGRPLSDSELFGFSQVNSEHCRHKIFGGQFVIDGEKKDMSLFNMIKQTSKENPNNLISAYKDNVAFNKGPEIVQFSPRRADEPSFFETKEIKTALSLKAETHNFPTTVEPFNGAATGTGGEIRDRLAGGKASLPLAGTAVYMTSYTRHNGITHKWEDKIKPRKWLYHSPSWILNRASDGASDFGNKFGQPLITGSLLTFEHKEDKHRYGYDKVIMLAGGIGYANRRDALKGKPEPGEKVVVMGGDNYRIGMGGGAVSSVDTGHYEGAIELNAVQRSNPEMQKRVANVIRAMSEGEENPIVSIHDHGAGGHLNCLSELVEETGGKIMVNRLPIGDPTLSAKEIIGNESQERMGLLVKENDIPTLKKIAKRERAPFYEVGQTTDDMSFVFEQDNGERPIDMMLHHMFGSAPVTVMEDVSKNNKYKNPDYSLEKVSDYISNVLELEAVGCKEFLTDKVDRSVTGKVAMQQCQGELQLPLADCGVVSLDYRGKVGIATSIGHAPQVALIDPRKGSQLSIAEALTNIVGAPLKDGIKSISLSANWMWPCKQEGEDARLFEAVEACSQFAIELGINIPTGKDSLSMTQKYPDGSQVLSPGTVIISAAGEVKDIDKIIGPVIQPDLIDSELIYIDFSFAPLALGGSAFFQSLGAVGEEAPGINEPEYFLDAFEVVQKLIKKESIAAIHDISAGGIITTLLEMIFSNTKGGLKINLTCPENSDEVIRLFAENPGIVIQTTDSKKVKKSLEKEGIGYEVIGKVIPERVLDITCGKYHEKLDVNNLRKAWYEPSYEMEKLQTAKAEADARLNNLGKQPLIFKFPENFKGKFDSLGLIKDRRNETSGIKAAIVRDKGTNGEREMAYALYQAGFDVKDIHMTDLTSGIETLEDIDFLVFCGGFSNSDVFGSAKGWAAGFLHNPIAKKTLDNFYSRKDTLSLGICNGCQLMAELGILYPDHEKKHKMEHNRSVRFESGFVSVNIPKNNSIMFGSLAGSTIPVWIAHGEGRFELPLEKEKYNITATYAYSEYPGNPNGSDFDIAALASPCGRHVAMMPHPERCIFPWQCAYYPQKESKKHEVTPWMVAFNNAFNWIKNNK